VYIGQADSFKNRLCSSHQQWAATARLGANTILAIGVTQQIERDFLEELLIRENQPVLNTQLRGLLGGGATLGVRL